MKFWIFLSCHFFAITFSFSQDILIRNSGDSSQVRILEVGLTEVKYKYYSDLDGLTYGIYKSEVKMIRYENGRVERFQDGKIVDENVLSMSATEKCKCGRSDAAKYHGRKGIAFACGAGCGIYGMLGTALMTHRPKGGMRTIQMSENKNLFNDQYYLKCYNKKAKADLLGMEVQGMLAAILVPLAIVFLIYR